MSAAQVAPVVVTPVASKADLRDFIALPRRLYAGHAGYAAPLDIERRDALTPGRNPLLEHVEAHYLLARRAGRVVGRISAQRDALHLERHADATGHFGCLAAEDDPEVFAALVGAAEAWLRSKGATRVTGPFSLSINEEVGLLVHGFDSRPMLMVPYDPPYAGPRLEACGYARLKDVLSYDYDVANAPPTIGARLLARGGLAGRVTVRTADMRRFDAEVRTLVDVFNDAWSDNWGFVPFTRAEIEHAAKALRPVIVPELAVFVDVDGETVAFILALANLAEAIAPFDGRLTPWNLARLLWRLRVTGVRSTRVPLMGVRKAYRGHPLLGAGLAMIAIDRLRENGRRLGKTSAELGWILEDNGPTNRIIRSVGGVHCKTHRIYEKTLA